MKRFNNKIRATFVWIVVVAFLGVIDYKTGYEFSFSVFYLIPVCLASWQTGFLSGLIISFASMISWYTWDITGGHVYSDPNIAYWNAVMRGLIFVFSSFMISRMMSIIKELRVARQRADEASHSKSMFLASMSHEIRTPMNAIIGVTDLLLNTQLNDEQLGYVEIFKEEGGHLLKLINDILDLSKIEANKFEVEKIAFDLIHVVEEVVSVMGMRAREKNLEFTHRVESNVPEYIVSAPHCLRRILINLLSNAIKFTDAGSVCLNVSMSSGSENEILFTVEDTGIGIPEDKVNNLFTPFEQVNDAITQKYGGTGLGLSISRKLLNMMDGRIWVESILGKGSRFSFVIPFDIPGEDQMKELELLRERSSNLSVVLADSRPLRILLVDDYDINRMLIRTFLKKTSYTIDEAENGEIAFNMFKASKYSVVLMDMQMPVIDGYAATKMIRSWENETNAVPTPIIALTAFAYKEDAEKTKDAGCDIHLSKPVNMTELLRIIQGVGLCSVDTSNNEDAAMKNTVVVDIDLKKLTEQFLLNVRTFVAEIGQGIEAGDFEKVKGIGHKLKGVGGSFGFPFISEIGGVVEKAAPLKEVESLKEHCLSIMEYLDNTEVRYE